MQAEVLDAFKSVQKINAKTTSERVSEGAAIISMAFSRVAVAA